MNKHEELRLMLKDGMKRHQKIGYDSFAFMDKALIFLSAGGIVLSVTFIKDIIGGESINNVVMLKATWVLWAATVFSVLLGYRLAQYENIRAIRKIYETQTELSSGDSPDPEVLSENLNDYFKDLNQFWGKLIAICNWVGFTAYFLGVVSMIWFAFLNT